MPPRPPIRFFFNYSKTIFRQHLPFSAAVLDLPTTLAQSFFSERRFQKHDRKNNKKKDNERAHKLDSISLEGNRIK